MAVYCKIKNYCYRKKVSLKGNIFLVSLSKVILFMEVILNVKQSHDIIIENEVFWVYTSQERFSISINDIIRNIK